MMHFKSKIAIPWCVALLHSVSYFFSLYRSASWSSCMVFDSISNNIDEVLSIIPSANVFVFGDFNVYHKDWLTYSGGTDRPGELCYSFFYLKWLSVILTVLLFCIYFFLLMYLFYNGFPSIGKFWSCCFLSFHWLSIKFIMVCPISSHSLWPLSCWVGQSLWSFERCSIGEYT